MPHPLSDTSSEQAGHPAQVTRNPEITDAVIVQAGEKNGAGAPTVLTGPQRILYFCLGILMLMLGVIGAVLPVMPTTIFIILAAWFFARSSPRFEQYILSHPRFGPLVIKWRERGAIPRRAKKLACGGMVAGYVLFLVGARPGLYLGLGVALFMLASAAYVLSRPEE